MIIKILALAVLTEALVELIFKAAPLQGIRARLIKKTPWLKSIDSGHLLDCKYCTSTWIAVAVLLLATFANCQGTRFAAAALIVARLSNYAHLVYSSIRDAQLNMRLDRKP